MEQSCFRNAISHDAIKDFLFFQQPRREENPKPPRFAPSRTAVRFGLAKRHEFGILATQRVANLINIQIFSAKQSSLIQQ